MSIRFLCFLVLLCSRLAAGAQVLDASTARTVSLSDGTNVNVLASADNGNWYYYLPPRLRLATRQNKPEISFLVYRNDAGGPVEGGLLHLLLTWGLTPKQEAELNQHIKAEIDSNAVLIGAPMLEPIDGSALEMVSTTGMATLLREALTNRVALPLSPDQKAALAFKFSGKNAALVSDALSNRDKWNEISFRFSYQYTVSHNEGYVRTTVRQKATVDGSFGEWIALVTAQTN